MKQKDIYLVDLNPVKGSEQSGKRPVVVVSGNTMNDNFGVAIVCPISSKIKNYPVCVQLKKNKTNNLKQDSEIITFQIRTISKNRLIKKLGKITDEDLAEVFKGLNTVLNY
ncbi:MAG: type II toxin-antitoxin system PemK/MazF family toxin [Candidatus Gracilibacteria bacterium]|jgi:mRNA interferase MazF